MLNNKDQTLVEYVSIIAIISTVIIGMLFYGWKEVWMKTKNKERTLAIVKPDGMVYLDEIIEAIYNEGFTIKDFYLKYLDKEILKEHYAHLINKPFFPELVDYMTSDKVAILLLEGDNIVERFRKLIGPTDSKIAGSETLRGKYGTDKSINAIHGSSSKEEAVIEIERFFKDRRN